MSNGNADPPAVKGKARASDAFDRSNDLETAPLLASTPSSSPAAAHQSRLRHGRGPLVNDDSDDERDRSTANGTANHLGGNHDDDDDDDDDGMRLVSIRRPSSSSHARGWTVGSVLCLLSSILFVTLLVVLAVLHLWVGRLLSEQTRHGDPQQMAERGLLWAGPSAVRVRANEAGAGILVELDAVAGIDVRRALDWERKDDGGWIRRAEGRMARWGVRKARSVSVNVGEVAIYDARDGFDSDQPLVVVPSLETLTLPLSYPTKANPVPDMHPFTLHVPLDFPSPADLARFGQAVWDAKTYAVRAEIREVVAHVGAPHTRGVAGWFLRRMKATRVTGLARVVGGEIPDMPIPDDPDKLANVTSISVFETASPAHPNTTVIAFAASALVANPLLDAIHDGRLPAIAFGMPFRVPVSIHLPLPPLPQGQRSPHDPHEIALAKVAMAPISFPLGSESAQLDVSGHLVPAGNLTPSAPTPPPPTSLDLSSSSRRQTTRKAEPQPPLSRALSRFVARYLAGRDNDVFVRYDAHPEPPLSDDPSPDAPFPPAFVADLVRGKELHVRVPGTNETPELFRDLRMEDMRIKLGGGDTDADLLASGKVVGEVVMPDIAAKLAAGLDAQWIWPDVLVYDGDLPRRAQQAALVDAPSSSLAKRAQLAFVDSSAPSSAFGVSHSGDDDELDALGGSDPADYPPSPVPANAFARMRPSSAMAAETIHTPANATHNATTFVVATFVDAPLYLLPGRGDVLRRFVAKIIFGGSGNKVKASMAGITSVRIALSGFGEVELEEIPIEASFMVGRGGIENPPALAARFLGLTSSSSSDDDA
ncbi:uncharacterized protein RHOBADRAFT_50558 [Rhodotorula graminis WP1]|uniref:Uncharacterized protein n=1 Tax=Rhodotorula graminis (strain WP1) TaxID=578459 RepID=A0A194SBQ8_RHOGW|nr:uncharacterized protein RHOBADRAFT_50558 [Rhodotorula graminis WP1]KPV78037.1 hypothetical protein RHOBADRAFT_50558 [Rhodotorula graminis WP1]